MLFLLVKVFFVGVMIASIYYLVNTLLTFVYGYGNIRAIKNFVF